MSMKERNAHPEIKRFREKKNFEKFPVCGPHRVLLGEVRTGLKSPSHSIQVCYSCGNIKSFGKGSRYVPCIDLDESEVIPALTPLLVKDASPSCCRLKPLGSAQRSDIAPCFSTSTLPGPGFIRWTYSSCRPSMIAVTSPKSIPYPHAGRSLVLQARVSKP